MEAGQTQRVRIYGQRGLQRAPPGEEAGDIESERTTFSTSIVQTCGRLVFGACSGGNS